MSELQKKLRSYNPTSGYSKVMRQTADYLDFLEHERDEDKKQLIALREERDRYKEALENIIKAIEKADSWPLACNDAVWYAKDALENSDGRD